MILHVGDNLIEKVFIGHGLITFGRILTPFWDVVEMLHPNPGRMGTAEGCGVL